MYFSLHSKVCVVGDELSVDAKHEEKSDGKFVSRQFSRKYTLPKGCDAAMVSSNLSSDGILARDFSADYRVSHQLVDLGSVDFETGPH